MDDFKVIQSVEDVQPTGKCLLRCRLGADPSVSSFGTKTLLYTDEEFKPQLYRLVTRYGDVVTANVFKKQAQYSVMDVLPVFPHRAVKEGDSWPDKFALKLEGLTALISMEGASQLDSFEWQDGYQCAKITSHLTANDRVSLNGGRIRGTGKLNLEMTTYFAYQRGILVRREMTLDFPAVMSDDAGEAAPATETTAVGTALSMPGAGLLGDEDNPDGLPVGPGQRRGRSAQDSSDSGNRKNRGEVEITTVVSLGS